MVHEEGIIRDNSDIDDHVILEVFIFRNERIALSILEADASTFVDTIEVLTVLTMDSVVS